MTGDSGSGGLLGGAIIQGSGLGVLDIRANGRQIHSPDDGKEDDHDCQGKESGVGGTKLD